MGCSYGGDFWCFVKASRATSGVITLQLSSYLVIQMSRDAGNMECTHDTKECLEFLFTLVQGTEVKKDTYSDPARMQRTIEKLKLQSDQAVEFTVQSYHDVNRPTVEAAAELQDIITRQSAELTVLYTTIVQTFKDQHGQAATAEACAAANPKLNADLIEKVFTELV